MTQISTARDTAFNLLCSIINQDAYSNLSLRYSRYVKKCDERDTKLVTLLVYGTLKRRIYLDYIIGKFANMNKIDSKVRIILEMSFLQLLELEGQEHAIVNEAGKLASKYTNPGAVGFVNGLLRNALRNRERWEVTDLSGMDYLEVKYSVPKNILYEIEDAIEEGIKFTEDVNMFDVMSDVLIAMSAPSKTTIRVNTLKIDVEAFKKLCDDNEIMFIVNPVFNTALTLVNATDINKLSAPEFKGLFSVQDPGAMIAVASLEPKEGDVIIDSCSAPGGKTIQMSQMINNNGSIIAMDITDKRIELTKMAVSQLGITCVNAYVENAAASTYSNKEADKILCDVPCSGLGLLGRKPEIRYTYTSEKSEALAKIQLSIIKHQAYALKPDGTGMYSTCTICNRENRDVMKAFYESNPRFIKQKITFDFSGLINEKYKDKVKQKHKTSVTVVPGIYDCDGFYMTHFKRRW